MDLLVFFLDNRDKIFSRAEILNRVWETGVYVVDRTIDVNVGRLRKKLGPYGNNIVTKQGQGYGFKTTH
jgi:DNA-binding response OmpR family regulator